MTPDTITDAIAAALMRGGQQLLVSTVAAFMPAMWSLTLMLHLARPYAVRGARKLSLRVGADAWWLSYVLVRDVTAVATLGLSVIFLMPDLLFALDLPATAPLSALLLLWAVCVKLLHDPDDDVRWHRVVTGLLVAGGTLYFVPQTIAIEASSQPYAAGLTALLDSRNDPALTGPVLAVSMAGSAVTVLVLFWRVLAGAGRRVRAEEEAPA